MRDVIVFGTALRGSEAHFVLSQLSEYRAVAFSCNNEAHWGGEKEGLPIIPPKDIPRLYKDAIVVIASAYYVEIRKQILDRELVPMERCLDSIHEIIRKLPEDNRAALISQLFSRKNYNYVWLQAMLDKASKIPGPGAVLITGSSYGVNGIIEQMWKEAVNCSVSSQDLYYDFQCAYKVISNSANERFSRCFIIGGYYAACHDLSRGKQEHTMISDVYYPIFKDGHNWREAMQNDLWLDVGEGEIPGEEKKRCEQLAIERMLQQGTYFAEEKQRGGTVFDLNGLNWWELPAEKRRELGRIRAESHNKLFQNKAAIEENRKILNDYVHFLHLNGIMPVFVIAPFTVEYTTHISQEMKASIFELLLSVSEKIRFVDFNQFTCFETSDFVDTDHLSEKGAEKFSRMLVELFKE